MHLLRRPEALQEMHWYQGRTVRTTEAYAESVGAREALKRVPRARASFLFEDE